MEVQFLPLMLQCFFVIDACGECDQALLVREAIACPARGKKHRNQMGKEAAVKRGIVGLKMGILAFNGRCSADYNEASRRD